MRKLALFAIPISVGGLYLLARPLTLKTTISASDAPRGLKYLIDAGVPADAQVHAYESGRGYNDTILAKDLSASAVQTILEKLEARTYEPDSTATSYTHGLLVNAEFPGDAIVSSANQLLVASADSKDHGYCRLWYDPSTRMLLISHYGESRNQ